MTQCELPMTTEHKHRTKTLSGAPRWDLAAVLAAALAGSLLGCAAPQSASGPTRPATASEVRIANPAAVACVQAGGRLQIERSVHGERGICVLPEGLRCDEWAWFRKEAGACCSTSAQPTGANVKSCS